MTDGTEIRDIFVSGLRDAHAMENQALAIMKPQVSRIENYPEIGARLERHIEETRAQRDRIARILDSLGEDNSTLKDAALSVTGSLAALGHTVAGDEILKNSFANFAFENYEIAAYRSLLALAEHGGYSSAADVLKLNLEEEQAMARWLHENLDKVTLQFAARREANLTAKT